jgi:hypothetical protein
MPQMSGSLKSTLVGAPREALPRRRYEISLLLNFKTKGDLVCGLHGCSAELVKLVDGIHFNLNGSMKISSSLATNARSHLQTGSYTLKVVRPHACKSREHLSCIKLRIILATVVRKAQSKSHE